MTGPRRRTAGRPRRCATLAATCLGLAGIASAILATSPRPTVKPTGARPTSSSDPRRVAVEVRAAAAQARRFLEGYLRYLHGQLAASRLGGVSPALSARLARDTVKAIPVARRRRARVVELHTHLDGRSRAVAAARILDGPDIAFTLTLTLHRAGAGWEVSDVT